MRRDGGSWLHRLTQARLQRHCRTCGCAGHAVADAAARDRKRLMVAITSERSASVEFDDALIQASQDLIDMLAANADAAERDGRLPDENIAALDAAGLRRLTLPRSAGGSEASALTILHVTDMLARGCASTSFVSTVYAASGYLICR